MTTKSTNIIEPTLADAFEVGKREGTKEILNEIKIMISSGMGLKELKIYIDARHKTTVELNSNNPFNKDKP